MCLPFLDSADHVVLISCLQGATRHASQHPGTARSIPIAVSSVSSDPFSGRERYDSTEESVSHSALNIEG